MVRHGNRTTHSVASNCFLALSGALCLTIGSVSQQRSWPVLINHPQRWQPEAVVCRVLSRDPCQLSSLVRIYFLASQKTESVQPSTSHRFPRRNTAFVCTHMHGCRCAGAPPHTHTLSQCFICFLARQQLSTQFISLGFWNFENWAENSAELHRTYNYNWKIGFLKILSFKNTQLRGKMLSKIQFPTNTHVQTHTYTGEREWGRERERTQREKKEKKVHNSWS